MGEKLGRSIKTFILTKLSESIDIILSALKNNNELSDDQYKSYLEFVYKVIEVLLRDELYEEWKYLHSKIEMEDGITDSNWKKMLNICEHLVAAGKNIIENY